MSKEPKKTVTKVQVEMQVQKNSKVIQHGQYEGQFAYPQQYPTTGPQSITTSPKPPSSSDAAGTQPVTAGPKVLSSSDGAGTQPGTSPTIPSGPDGAGTLPSTNDPTTLPPGPNTWTPHYAPGYGYYGPQQMNPAWNTDVAQYPIGQQQQNPVGYQQQQNRGMTKPQRITLIVVLVILGIICLFLFFHLTIRVSV